ncbi:TPA: hypothetical protein ENX78_12880 [Candidatus Poribacteria bacterium]|nr:hypothetical protein [Candidatus Poribacteria bacterium]
MERPLFLINDHKKVEEVYNRSQEYLEIHRNLKDAIATHLWAYHEIGDLIPETVDRFWSGHFFPFSESYYELENSFELCMEGFYRYSLFALRCVLELGVMGLYFDKDDQAHIDVQNWLHSVDPTPHFRIGLRRLFELEYFRRFNGIFSLQKEVEEIYSKLSDYAHVRGYLYSTSGQTRSNFNQFNASSLRFYVGLMTKIVKSIVIMMLLKYPIGMQDLPLWKKFGLNSPVGGFLNETSRPVVLAILDVETRAVLQDISDKDPQVFRIISGILAMPDLPEAQLKKQIAEWDKMMEERGAKREKPDEEGI